MSGHCARTAWKPANASESCWTPGMPCTMSTLPLPPIFWTTLAASVAAWSQLLTPTPIDDGVGTGSHAVTTGMPALPAASMAPTNGAGARGSAMMRSGLSGTSWVNSWRAAGASFCACGDTLATTWTSPDFFSAEVMDSNSVVWKALTGGSDRMATLYGAGWLGFQPGPGDGRT